jgi:exopolysaccharide biosynthesis protein
MLELSHALLALGCTDALNLDGGPSSTLCVGGRVVNVSQGLEDAWDDVGSALAVLPGVAGRDDVR